MEFTEKRCIIVSAGDLNLTHFEISEDDYVIAADGGYLHCLTLVIEPDLILGDFDSLAPELAKTIKNSEKQIKVLPVRKDDTDTMAALRLGLELGYHEFVILGALGGRRFSHSIANLQALKFLEDQDARGVLLQDGMEVFLCSHSCSIPAHENGYFSVFAFGGNATGITIRDAGYELEGGELTAAFPIGVSNHFVDNKKASLRVTEGTLLVVVEY